MGPSDTLHNEVADALARGLITPAEVAGITDAELTALSGLCARALEARDALRAQILARTLIVLAPYRASGWLMLADVCRLNKDDLRAAHAQRAAALLTPIPASPRLPTPLLALPPVEVPADSSQSTAVRLVLHDGRALPLRDSPAALHHDTVTARITAQGLVVGGRPQKDVVEWAQGGDEDAAYPPARKVTLTSIVVRPQADAAQNKPDPPVFEPSAVHTVTSKIDRPQRRSAAARRQQGWPVTDTWVLSEIDPGSATQGGT